MPSVMDLTVLVDDSPCLANAILHPVLWTDCRCPKSHCNAGKRARSALSVDSSHKTISRTRPSPEVSRRRYGCRHPRNACEQPCKCYTSVSTIAQYSPLPTASSPLSQPAHAGYPYGPFRRVVNPAPTMSSRLMLQAQPVRWIYPHDKDAQSVADNLSLES